MKLNKFIFKKFTEPMDTPRALTEDQVEDWICEWYMETFSDINCGEDGKPRMPPTWLAGPRWYDRRRKIIEKAEKENNESTTDRNH